MAARLPPARKNPTMPGAATQADALMANTSGNTVGPKPAVAAPGGHAAAFANVLSAAVLPAAPHMAAPALPTPMPVTPAAAAPTCAAPASANPTPAMPSAAMVPPADPAAADMVGCVPPLAVAVTAKPLPAPKPAAATPAARARPSVRRTAGSGDDTTGAASSGAPSAAPPLCPEPAVPALGPATLSAPPASPTLPAPPDSAMAEGAAMPLARPAAPQSAWPGRPDAGAGTPPAATNTLAVPSAPGAGRRLTQASGQASGAAPGTVPAAPAEAAAGNAMMPLPGGPAAPPVTLHAVPSPVPANPPSAAAPAAQLGAALATLSGGAAQTLVVRLHPEELGHVEITVARPSAGPARVSLVAERPETLLLLLRDQDHLNQALDRAGIPAESRSLSFALAAQPVVAPAPADSGGDRSGGQPGMAFGYSAEGGGGQAAGDGGQAPGNGGGGREPPSRSFTPGRPRMAAEFLAGIDITA